jgi:carbonic anhydrase
MTRIIQGVLDFHDRVFDEKRELFEGLQAGQRPLALFVTCADARINPNLLTQTEPGELFVLRNAGNLIPPAGPASGGEGATIEYAVRHLRVRDIIVCGHSYCGAMQALITPGALDELPHVAAWLEHASPCLPRVQAVAGRLTPAERIKAVTEQNVLVQLDHLRTYRAVADALQEGRLRLHGWVYHFENGEVQAYDAAADSFAPLSAAKRKSITSQFRAQSPPPTLGA